jgi:hypothetical protein
MNFKDLAVGFILAALFITLLLESCCAQTGSEEFSVDTLSVDEWVDAANDLDVYADMLLNKHELIADTFAVRGVLRYTDFKGEFLVDVINLVKICYFCPEGGLVSIEFQFYTKEGRIFPSDILEFRERQLFRL